MALVPRFSKNIPNYAKNLLNGLEISNSPGDTANDIIVAVGSATDSTNSITITLSSAIIKRLDANWALGTNQGGLDTGSKVANITYHVYLISNGANADVLFSTSATSPALPVGYGYFRRIASILTNGSANIRQFVQNGDYFTLTPGHAFINQSAAAQDSDVTTNLLPNGINVEIWGSLQSVAANSNALGSGMILPPGTSSTAPSSIGVGAGGAYIYPAYAMGGHVSGTGSNQGDYGPTFFRTMIRNATVRLRTAIQGAGNISTQAEIHGFVDTRGKS